MHEQVERVGAGKLHSESGGTCQGIEQTGSLLGRAARVRQAEGPLGFICIIPGTYLIFRQCQVPPSRYGRRGEGRVSSKLGLKLSALHQGLRSPEQR